jgi:hypothetical protein
LFFLFRPLLPDLFFRPVLPDLFFRPVLPDLFFRPLLPDLFSVRCCLISERKFLFGSFPKFMTHFFLIMARGTCSR